VTPEQYRAALARLGWTQSSAARLLGVNLRTSQRWASGDQDVPPPAEKLLLVAENVPGVTDALLDAAMRWWGALESPHQPRGRKGYRRGAAEHCKKC
jgi:transcriptional regulator with XRE-family HTH domain